MWVTFALVLLLLFLLIVGIGAPHYLFMAGCVILILCDIISMEEFISGFSNEGMMTIGLMFAIVTPVSKTGILQWFTRRVFIFKRFPVFNLVFLMATCSFLSMWMNNTPIVALFIPIIKEWSEKNDLPASKFLIPLSYSTIAGGMCTIIGTSTNLVVNGFLEAIHEKEFGFFELGMLGLPLLGILMVWILLIGYWLLPSNKSTSSTEVHVGVKYITEIPVLDKSYLIGQSIARVQEKYMVEVVEILKKDSENTLPVLNDVLKAGDVIYVLATQHKVTDMLEMITLDIEDLYKAQTLGRKKIYNTSSYEISSVINDEDDDEEFTPKKNKGFLSYFKSTPKTTYHYYQVILSDENPVLTSKLKDYSFQRKYNAAVYAVKHNGKEITNLNDYSMKMGDTLIIVATDEFASNWAESTDFYSIQKLEPSKHAHEEKSVIVFWGKKFDISWWKLMSIPIFVCMVTVAAFGYPMIICAMITLMVLITLGIADAGEAVDAIDFQLLILIACSFGFGRGIQNSYLAEMISKLILKIPFPVYILPGIVFFLTQSVSACVTNNAAATILFPVAVAIAHESFLNVRPFAVAVALGASADFSTPIGYQTNLMVQAPGGYKFIDYTKVGFPLNLIMAGAATGLIPLIWPLHG